ncbi:hypothetical protein [Ferroacidibacillus organovorans]|nr:hypothetical protein [Ferroacidibacillus organovorans]
MLHVCNLEGAGIAVAQDTLPPALSRNLVVDEILAMYALRNWP